MRLGLKRHSLYPGAGPLLESEATHYWGQTIGINFHEVGLSPRPTRTVSACPSDSHASESGGGVPPSRRTRQPCRSDERLSARI
ncbi:YxiG-like protein [Streptomyces chartreusis]